MPTTLDCTLLRDLFGTARMRAVFDSHALLQAWLDAEAALAEAEAEVGVIPAWAAEGIRAAAVAESFDLDRLRESIGLSHHPLVPAIRALTEAAGDAGRYVHWGATTQDIIDTGAVLQIRNALELIDGTLAELLGALAELAVRHRDTIMAGRTHGQHAVPITFGLKVAIWLDELGRSEERLAQVRPRLLVGELAGAAGTLASLGADAAPVRSAFCRRLGLATPSSPWHAARDAPAELISALGMLAATMEKIAQEIIRLQSTEVAEASESHTADHVGSSTMPQKRNPMLCEYVAAVCKLVRGLAPVMVGAMVNEHERDMASWAAEWLLVPQALIMTDGALTQLLEVVGGLEVDEARMRANLELSGGTILAEAVMLALGAHIGHEQAHHLMTEVAAESARRGVAMSVALSERPEVLESLAPDELERLLDPSLYLGEASSVAAAVAARRRPRDGPGPAGGPPPAN